MNCPSCVVAIGIIVVVLFCGGFDHRNVISLSKMYAFYAPGISLLYITAGNRIANTMKSKTIVDGVLLVISYYNSGNSDFSA